MELKEKIISTCKEILSTHKSRHLQYKVPFVDFDFLSRHFQDGSHIQTMYTDNGINWYTDIDGERVDLGEYPDFYQPILE